MIRGCFLKFSNSIFCSTGAIPIVFSDFGSGEDLILLTNLNCTGQEDNLAQCPHNGVAQLSCSHFEDSGVVCRGVECVCVCVCVVVRVIHVVVASGMSKIMIYFPRTGILFFIEIILH